MKLNSRYFRYWVCIVMLALLGGCAFGTREATLVYPPAPDGEAKAAPGKVAKAEPREPKIQLFQFRDERTEKAMVGTVRNGYGMRTADVISNNSVTDWVTQALKLELQNRGFTVVTGTSKEGVEAGTIVISGEILNVFCDMYFSYTGQVSLVVKVSNSAGEMYSRHYAGEGSAGIAFAATAESFAQSLSLALSSALNKLVSDLEAKLGPPKE